MCRGGGVGGRGSRGTYVGENNGSVVVLCHRYVQVRVYDGWRGHFGDDHK